MPDPVREQVRWWQENGFTAHEAMSALGLEVDSTISVSWVEVEIVARGFRNVRFWPPRSDPTSTLAEKDLRPRKA